MAQQQTEAAERLAGDKAGLQQLYEAGELVFPPTSELLTNIEEWWREAGKYAEIVEYLDHPDPAIQTAAAGLAMRVIPKLLLKYGEYLLRLSLELGESQMIHHLESNGLHRRPERLTVQDLLERRTGNPGTS